MSVNIPIHMIVGTRADGLKMAPLYKQLLASALPVKLISTGQHRDLLQQVFSTFDIRPDIDLDVMSEQQTLSEMTQKIVSRYETVIAKNPPAAVLVHGDTLSSYASSLVAFYNKVPIGHVEAGLRTHNINSPFPEEFHRQSIAKMATWHFAPDAIAKKNLVKDGIEASDILVTGNTIRDSVMQAIPSSFARNKKADSSILVTLHRREKGEYAQKSILNAIAKFACEYPSTTVYYPLRPQPKMKLLAKNTFRSQKNVRLLPPLKHRDFLHLLSEVDLVVTDSGGIQEEAALLGKRTLILRDRSERPDGISEGLVEVIGCKPLHLDLQISCALLNAKNSSSRLINTPSPSGLITRFVIQQTVGWGA